MKGHELIELIKQLGEDKEVVFQDNVYSASYLEIDEVVVRKLSNTGDFNQLEADTDSNEEYICIE